MSEILLKDLKVGDEVWMANSYSGGKDLYKIERLTKSQIIFRIGISEARFNRENGVRIGVGWRARSTIFPVTPDIRQTVVDDMTRRNLWAKLDRVSDQALFALIAAMVFGGAGYVIYLDSRSPTFTLKKDEWRCTKSHTVSDVQLIPQSNEQTILLPVISTVCDRYERVENVSQNDSTGG